MTGRACTRCCSGKNYAECNPRCLFDTNFFLEKEDFCVSLVIQLPTYISREYSSILHPYTANAAANHVMQAACWALKWRTSEATSAKCGCLRRRIHRGAYANATKRCNVVLKIRTKGRRKQATAKIVHDHYYTISPRKRSSEEKGRRVPRVCDKKRQKRSNCRHLRTP